MSLTRDQLAARVALELELLRETAPGVSVVDVQSATGAPLTVADDVREMPVPATVA